MNQSQLARPRWPLRLILVIVLALVGQRAQCSEPATDLFVESETFADKETWPITTTAGVDDLNNPAEKSDAAGAADKPDRPLGSAFFGGDRGPPVFGPPLITGNREAPKWPDISQPGPDMGDFPNSAFTLPKGRAYLEFSPATVLNSDRQSPATYDAPFLLRYGLTDDVEFRVFGNGLTVVEGSQGSTGFSPLNLDLKIHLWDDRKEWLIPAMSFEVYLLTEWGSSQFTGGWEPSINLNFDLPICERTNLEWTVGYSGVQQAFNIHTQERFVPRFGYLVPGIHRTVDRNFNQVSAQWAIEQEITKKLQLFIHGAHNGSVIQRYGSGQIVGVGGFWKFSDRLMGFGSLNTGLSPNLPTCAIQVGFAVAL
ncbi:MAG: transporter [Planctomycetes bacterium]|nr:transporter [Planctomycetota bacterium]